VTRFDYDELKAELEPKALRLRARLGRRSSDRRGGRPRDPSRLRALIRLADARLRQLEAEGRFEWEGRRITLR